MASSNPAAAARYTPGSWLGVVRSGTVVLLRPDSAPALIDSLWELLAAGPEAHEVLDAVSSASGGSLSRLPWFAIVASRGPIHVFLRGEIDLTVDLPSGPVELSGREVTTWTERRFAAADGFSLTVPGANAAGSSGTAADLPLADGVVLLRGLRVDFTGAAADDAAAEEAAVEDEVLAAAEADIAADLSGHGASAETVLEFAGEDFELDGTLHEEPEPDQAAEPEPEVETAAAGLEAVPSAQPPGTAPEPAEQEPTGSYDHLWEQTVMRNIEDAAVREDPDAEPAVESAPDASGPGAAGSEPEPAPAGATEAAETEAAPAPELPAPPRAPLPTGLIDSVPWRTGGDRRPQTAQASQAPAPALAPSPAPDADHDGQTIMKSDLAGASPRPPTAPRPSTGPDTGPATGPMVLARVCPQGHANPSTYSQCGRCGRPLPGDGVQVRRPRLGRVRLSTGELIDLDQSLIVGRQPSVSRVQGAVMPKLVQVASPSGDISRSHVEVRLEGWHVMLCDLKATNGTVLVREGHSPRRLAQGEMAILLDGDIAEVGDGISLRFEEIP
ncbi:FHA domain-containing protein [Arthrobacter sp. UYEF36]|uniref:FHA domain-containing protein n=1 Tax=Arthrobacter sp. UYEF36 TaxID=1756366 RepID=UPI0033952BE7